MLKRKISLNETEELTIFWAENWAILAFKFQNQTIDSFNNKAPLDD